MSRSDDSLPRLAAAVLRLLLPDTERDEVLVDLGAEYAARREKAGRRAASGWLWRQVFGSVPSLVRRGWWRGWSGFETEADRMRPSGSVIESWAQDVRFTLRRLRRRPTFTVLSVLTLALGVAGTAAVFSIAQRLLFDPLPVAAEEEVAVFWMEGSWSQAEFVSVRPDIEGFRSVAAYRPAELTLVSDHGPARLLRGMTGTAELFDVFGVRPAIGPGFRPGDDVLGAEPVVVLSHSLWQELGGDPGIIGEQIELSGVARTVVGVMPPGFWFPDPTARLWVSLILNPENQSGNYGLIGRMPPGVGIDQMTVHLDRLTSVLRERFEYAEAWDKTQNAALIPAREYVVGSSKPAVLALLAAMALILLVACVNVAALMLGQIDSRGTELAVRSALGAGRQRLLKQIVIESLVIGVLAGVVATWLAVLGFGFLVEALPLGALAEAAAVDWRVVVAALAIALLAATMVALIPASSAARGDVQDRLTRSRTAGVGGRGGRLEGGLVIVQVALVLMMASGATLLIRSVANLRAIDPGVETAGLAVVDVVMPVTTPTERRPPLMRELVEALSGLPGVASAAATQRLPLRGSSDNWGISVESRPDLASTSTAFRVVTPEYFATMGIRIISGRGLLETDRLATDEGAVVINQALAERYFPGVDPLGQRIGFMDRWDRVVGVVENVAESSLTTGPEPARYMLYDQVPWLLHGQTLVIRMHDGRDPRTVLNAARRAIHAAAPMVAVQEVTTMDAVFAWSVGPARHLMALLTLLGGLALALGVVGVYGVVSHFVTRRRRDWAIRIALGQSPVRVVSQVLKRGGALVAIGIAFGTVAFLTLARLLASFLYGVGTADPLALAGAAALILAAGLVAAFIPARRAGRTDPALVLRE